MASFDAAYKRTILDNEGPYDNDPKDPGGETVFGITRKYNGTWPGWKLINHWQSENKGWNNKAIAYYVTNNKTVQYYVKKFYEDGPWADIRGNNITSQAIAEELFDSGVNCGVVRTVKWLQRALNVFNQGSSDYPNVDVDGVMGSRTMDALNKLIEKRGVIGERVLLRALDAQQGMRYLELAEANPSLETFEVGWWDKRIS